MRLLILSCNTGEGHNSCAKAVKEAWEAEGGVCEIRDALSFISPRFARFISWGHATMYRRFPGLFRKGYPYFEAHPGSFEDGSAVTRILHKGAEGLHRCIVEGKYDAVLCVHVLSALMLTEVQERYALPIRTAFAATDYTCSPSVKQSRLERYFIPDAALAEEFTSPNTPAEKLTASGIPVRPAFRQRVDKEEAKRRCGVCPDHAHLVMMCGSMGCGPMKRLAALLADRLDTGCELTVVCGTNEKLRRRLARRCGDAVNVHILGYVADMSVLLDSADLYLTKPGGLSSTEAALKGLPMVFIDAVAGCETYNARWFAQSGGAVNCTSPKEAADACLRLLNDRPALEQMRAALAAREKPDSAAVICEGMKAGTAVS